MIWTLTRRYSALVKGWELKSGWQNRTETSFQFRQKRNRNRCFSKNAIEIEPYIYIYMILNHRSLSNALESERNGMNWWWVPASNPYEAVAFDWSVSKKKFSLVCFFVHFHWRLRSMFISRFTFIQFRLVPAKISMIIWIVIAVNNRFLRSIVRKHYLVGKNFFSNSNCCKYNVKALSLYIWPLLFNAESESYPEHSINCWFERHWWCNSVPVSAMCESSLETCTEIRIK